MNVLLNVVLVVGLNTSFELLPTNGYLLPFSLLFDQDVFQSWFGQLLVDLNGRR